MYDVSCLHKLIDITESLPKMADEVCNFVLQHVNHWIFYWTKNNSYIMHLLYVSSDFGHVIVFFHWKFAFIIEIDDPWLLLKRPHSRINFVVQFLKQCPCCLWGFGFFSLIRWKVLTKYTVNHNDWYFIIFFLLYF